MASKNFAYCPTVTLVLIHEKGIQIDSTHRLFVCISRPTPHHKLPRRHQHHRPVVLLGRRRFAVIQCVPLLNFLVQLLVDGLLFVVEPELVRNFQGVLGLGDLLGGGVRLGDGLLPFVQQAPHFGLAPPLFGQPGHRGFRIKLQRGLVMRFRAGPGFQALAGIAEIEVRQGIGRVLLEAGFKGRRAPPGTSVVSGTRTRR